jgi:hypothetical protein
MRGILYYFLCSMTVKRGILERDFLLPFFINCSILWYSRGHIYTCNILRIPALLLSPVLLLYCLYKNVELNFTLSSPSASVSWTYFVFCAARESSMHRRKITGCTQTTSILFFFVNFFLRTLVTRKTKSVLKQSKIFFELLQAVWKNFVSMLIVKHSVL